MMKTRNEYFQFKKSLSTYKYNFKRGSSLNYFYRGIAVFRYGPGPPFFQKLDGFSKNLKKFSASTTKKFTQKILRSLFHFHPPPHNYKSNHYITWQISQYPIENPFNQPHKKFIWPLPDIYVVKRFILIGL